jgi:hypothetical protein
MVGKWAIHPKQIALANEVFTPSEERCCRGPATFSLPCNRPKKTAKVPRSIKAVWSISPPSNKPK